MADDNKDFDGIKYRGETPPPTIFNILFYGLLIFGVVFIAYYLFSGWSSEGEFAERKKAQEAAMKAAAPAPSARAHKEDDAARYLAEGKKIYGERCAVCHGADGKGGIGPDLTKKDLKYGKGDKELAESIEKGRAGGMPAFGGQISHEQVEGLVAFVKSL
jgi:cytochrome c oxidase cbb3-type subunit 3